MTFSFGANWLDFLATIPGEAVERALADHRQWLDDAQLQGARVLDIGCGSGLHALVFQLRGAGAVTAIDRDPASVSATRQLRERLGRPAGWSIEEGSILDAALVERLARTPFDIVYSWGVLHHTGAMWQALEHAFRLVAPGGRLWISLYAAGPRYARHLALKRRYNGASRLGKWWLERLHIAMLMLQRLRQGRNPLAWNQSKERGMDTWHDLVDWLGGLPYEVAGIGAVVAAARAHGFTVLRIAEAPEGSCQVFLFQHVAGSELAAAPGSAPTPGTARRRTPARTRQRVIDRDPGGPDSGASTPPLPKVIACSSPLPALRSQAVPAASAARSCSAPSPADWRARRPRTIPPPPARAHRHRRRRRSRRCCAPQTRARSGVPIRSSR